jgi:hypothetical protein
LLTCRQDEKTPAFCSVVTWFALTFPFAPSLCAWIGAVAVLPKLTVTSLCCTNCTPFCATSTAPCEIATFPSSTHWSWYWTEPCALAPGVVWCPVAEN